MSFLFLLQLNVDEIELNLDAKINDNVYVLKHPNEV